MGTPFRGLINVDVTKSVPDWAPYTQPIAPEGTPSVLYIVLDDVGYSAMGAYGGLIETPNIDRIAAARPDLHQLPHDGAVLADAVVPDDRAEPHDEQHGQHHRGGRWLPEFQRAHPVRGG